MANNLDFSKLENFMMMEAKKFTPEYMRQLSKKAYKEDREYPENFSNWYPHIKSFGNFAHADVISNQILTLFISSVSCIASVSSQVSI